MIVLLHWRESSYSSYTLSAPDLARSRNVSAYSAINFAEGRRRKLAAGAKWAPRAAVRRAELSICELVTWSDA